MVHRKEFFLLDCEPQEHSPCAPKLEHRTQEETLQPERSARREALDLAKNVCTLNEKDNVTFFSPSEVWSLPAPSSKKLEERDFVVDSGASLHRLIRKDLNSARLETFQRSRNPPTVTAANGEVQENEEATGYIHDFELFVTVQILEDTKSTAIPTSGPVIKIHS